MMNKTKWIVGLSIAGLIAYSGSVFAAINSRSVQTQAIAKKDNYLLTVYKNPNLEATSNTGANNSSNNPSFGINQPANIQQYSVNSDSNSTANPGPYGYPGGYGMMGGYGFNGYPGGYDMMGGYYNSSNGNDSNGNNFSNSQGVPYCGGYGFMNGYGYGNGSSNDSGNGNIYNQSLKDGNSAAKDMETSLTNATIDKSSNTITYTGSNVTIVMLGGPEEADGKFVIGGLINPMLKIPQGANVTMEIINEDNGMPHGVEITTATPPYAYMPMMQGAVYPGSFIPPVPESTNNQYPSAQVSFSASQTGEFYYICQYPGHAAKGMYGKIIIG